MVFVIFSFILWFIESILIDLWLIISSTFSKRMTVLNKKYRHTSENYKKHKDLS